MSDDRYADQDSARERDETFEVETATEGRTMSAAPDTQETPAEEVEAEVVTEEEIARQEAERAGGDHRTMTHLEVEPREPRGGDSLPMEMSVDALVARVDKLHEAADKVLQVDVDYGTIPGVKKPSLLKPGAEKLCMLFMLDPETDVEEHLDADGHLSVTARTTIYHAPTGTRLGTGIGSCTTRETRYGYRQAQRTCPRCEQETVFRSKNTEGEWYCWTKKGGCGANFDAGSDEAIALATVDVGRKARPREELADFYNTVLKMARKRSLIDAVLVTTGASSIYTQDVEDIAPDQMQERRTDGQRQVKTPQSFAEAKAMLEKAYGAGTVEDFGAFAWELAQSLYGAEVDVGDVFGRLTPTALDPSQWTAFGQKVAGATVNLLEAEKGDGFPPPTRDQIRAAFAKVADGVQLEGPAWSMGPDEKERPPRAEQTPAGGE
jgi:ribosomal protein L37AE/L43A